MKIEIRETGENEREEQNKKIEREMKKKMKKKTDYNLNNKDTIKKVNAVIKQTENRKGLWRTKHNIADMKMRKYCAKNNIANTDGGWVNKKYARTKSYFQNKIENGDFRISDSIQLKQPEEIKIKDHRAIILYEKATGKCDAYNAEIEKINGEIIAKIIAGRRKIEVRVRKEKIEDEEIIKIALQNRAEIYVI